jgi:hypothetical protein
LGRQGQRKERRGENHYYFHNERLPVFMLGAYAKNERADISKAERNVLKKLVPQLVKEYLRRSLR